MEVAYYPGCTLHASSEMYDVQSKLVFKQLGIDLREIEDWNCCGATSASKTDEFLAVALPARNLGIADASGLSEMFIPCSSCLSRTLVSQKTLADNPALRDRINSELNKKVQGKTRIVSILEMLVPKAESGDLAKRTKGNLVSRQP